MGVLLTFLAWKILEKYLDLNDVLPHIRMEITIADITDLQMGLFNYPSNPIFSQCYVTLGDKLISQSSATHPYRAMIITLLKYSDNSLKSQFTAGLYFKDTGGAMNSIVTNNGPNK